MKNTPHGPWSQWNVEIPDQERPGFVERGCLVLYRGMGVVNGAIT